MGLWVSSRGLEGLLAFSVTPSHSLHSFIISNISGHLAAMGATFAFTEAVVANERQKNDALNGAAAGCAAGFLTGIRCRF